MPKQQSGSIPGAKTSRDATAMQRETWSKIAAGCTITDLSMLFRLDARTVRIRLADVPPDGKRGNYPLWQIITAAPYLVKPAYDVEQYIKKMRPNDLPPLLLKEYWNGQRARQRFEEDEGLLWRTQKVVETLSEVFKTARMTILLLPDTLERETTLTDSQRQIIRDECDKTLEAMRDNLVEKFEPREDERDLSDFFALPGEQSTDGAAEGEDDFSDVFDIIDEDDHGL